MKFKVDNKIYCALFADAETIYAYEQATPSKTRLFRKDQAKIEILKENYAEASN